MDSRTKEFMRVHTREELVAIHEQKNSVYDTTEFTEALKSLISGDESHRGYVERVLAHRARSAFIQSGYHPANEPN